MGKIYAPTGSSTANTVTFLKAGTSGCSVYLGEVKVFPSDDNIADMKNKPLTFVNVVAGNSGANIRFEQLLNIW